MKLVQWLSPPLSRATGHALVRVEAGEVADAEAMLKLVDGDTVGHFGLQVRLISTGEKPPELRPTLFQAKPLGPDYLSPKAQLGFRCASTLREQVR